MARYSIGIDLGTTHSAVSYFNLEDGKSRGRAQSMLPIPQLTAPGTVEARPLLPSFLYLPAAQEFPKGSLALPWNPEATSIIGELARSHGAKVPTRLVSSPKSWLSHPGVDRRSAMLPWQAPEDVQRVSPLDASARFLRHLREAWDATFAQEKEDSGNTLAEQDVIVTVPASFDAAARELTLEAAKAAGIAHLTLLEEPQAALYAWLEAMGESFRQQVKPGEVILVVDVGGGTTDFSVITVRDSDGEVELLRVAVGDHILLGGDNMDLALAHTLNQRLTAEGKKLDPWQFNALTHGCRQAKETLYADTSLDKVSISVPSRGSSLIGGTLRTELTREELERVLTDGFFPVTPLAELPRTARRTGLAQMALPYAQDPGVSRHLAAFLTRQAQALASSHDAPVAIGDKSFLHPTAVLFNGGVFKAGPLKARVMEVLNLWLKADGGEPAKELEGADLDLSVARGAAYYGWVKQGHGLRIRGGTARAYYVGVESAMPAVPGFEPPVKALCVAPFGMEEGTQADVPPQEFGLVTGEPTSFRFFSSSMRRDDTVGVMVDDVADELAKGEMEELAPIETTMSGQPSAFGDLTPVNLQAAVTEVGTLELRCLEKGGPGRWKLELNVRLKE
ncbi:heat shock protein 70 family protein [Myxococcus stipitatus DSM 14675]|uniref:Heat shock protein 70 family protein n=1 Tax=Myxococcus stipitatus (strain DSM 14675 / JCM 12634 / Mx s8) TaxID=1278073 RepID=L7UE14_MYXSD|nr:Hsp70 family protein [Myxococcus stipitatus]AGC47161.1 heat shock protein 70 family protein [Myxococcus stipitatus DSM 14675]